MSDIPLYQKHCVPCEGNVPKFSTPSNLEHLKRINEWHLNEDISIEKILLFKDFAQAIQFINKVAEIAEQENHHPDILLFGWNKVKLSLTTHAIGGLSDNDYILASKIDQIIL
jgi:4a-hydroxytetrahydrobiopterin dehydratase